MLPLIKTITSIAALLLAANAYGQTNPYLGLPSKAGLLATQRTSPTVQLGKRIFFDTRLSKDGAVSCGSCHIEEKAFNDGKALAEGHAKARGTRNTPSLLNAAFNTSFFWDGRRDSLEAQALDPFLNPMEHGLIDVDQLRRAVEADPSYRAMFRKAFGSEGIDAKRIAGALAAFEKTLLSGNSAFDRFQYGGDTRALGEREKHGLLLFKGAARCVSCHTTGPEFALFSDQRFHAIGVGRERLLEHLPRLTQQVVSSSPQEKDRLIFSDPLVAALGRFTVTGNPVDIGAFRTPSLRNVALTAPYMHDGSVATLEDAVSREIYYRGNEDGRPLILTPQEVEDLVAFLRSLTSDALKK